jgi:hypothetical protein
MSRPPNKLVNIRFVSMCPPRTGPAGSLHCDVRGDPPWARNARIGAPYPDASWCARLLPGPALARHTRTLPSVREDQVLGAKGGFGQVWATRLASRGDLSVCCCDSSPLARWRIVPSRSQGCQVREKPFMIIIGSIAVVAVQPHPLGQGAFADAHLAGALPRESQPGGSQSPPDGRDFPGAWSDYSTGPRPALAIPGRGMEWTQYCRETCSHLCSVRLVSSSYPLMPTTFRPSTLRTVTWAFG